MEQESLRFACGGDWVSPLSADPYGWRLAYTAAHSAASAATTGNPRAVPSSQRDLSRPVGPLDGPLEPDSEVDPHVGLAMLHEHPHNLELCQEVPAEHGAAEPLDGSLGDALIG